MSQFASELLRHAGQEVPKGTKCLFGDHGPLGPAFGEADPETQQQSWDLLLISRSTPSGEFVLGILGICDRLGAAFIFNCLQSP